MGSQVTHLMAAYVITAAHSHTPTRCRGHSWRYQRLNPSKGSMGLGGLYTVSLLAAVLLLTLACPGGIEPPTHSLEGCCSIH